MDTYQSVSIKDCPEFQILGVPVEILSEEQLWSTFCCGFQKTLLI